MYQLSPNVICEEFIKNDEALYEHKQDYLNLARIEIQMNIRRPENTNSMQPTNNDIKHSLYKLNCTLIKQRLGLN